MNDQSRTLRVLKDIDQAIEPEQQRRVCVVGLGYIGLPTASILASRGHQVIGVDVRPDVVETINQGQVHIVEPHLDGLVREVVQRGALQAQAVPAEADVFFICVPTPMTADHAPDLRYVEAACESIQPLVRKGNLVILESTSPPGTTRDIVACRAIPSELTIGEDVYVAHCPERVLPGRILIEAVENDRVLGGLTPRCAEQTRRFYQTFVQGEMHTTSAAVAELSKLTENAFRDVNIAFANELSMFAERFDADPLEVIALANKHPRVNILQPGPGVGGHCISVDPWFLVHAAPELTPLMKTARQVNDQKPKFVVQQIRDLAEASGAKTIGCLGLAYKADVDDLRESPSMDIVRELRSSGDAEVLACDPFVDAAQFSEFPLHSLDEVLEQSDMVVLLTDHSPFRELEAERLDGKTVLDTRGCWRHLPLGSSVTRRAA